MRKINLVEITFTKLQNIKNTGQYFDTFAASNGYLNYLSKSNNVTSIKFVGFREIKQLENLQFIFSNRSNYLSKLALVYKFSINQKDPLVFLIHGFRFPHCVLIMKVLFPRSKFILWNHAEQPSKYKLINFAFYIQNKFVDAYLFNGVGNANGWVDKNILSDQKVFEIPEASTSFKYTKNKFSDIPIIIWIGRLIQGKNPIYFLKSILQIHLLQIEFKVEFIYQSGPLEQLVTNFIKDNHLDKIITLHKNIEHTKVEEVLNQSHFYVSCSAYEGSSYSLIESLACGCMPMVSNIAPHQYLLNDFFKKYLFDLDDEDGLLTLLKNNIGAFQNRLQYDETRNNFDKYLSYNTIAKKIELHIQTILK